MNTLSELNIFYVSLNVMGLWLLDGSPGWHYKLSFMTALHNCPNLFYGRDNNVRLDIFNSTYLTDPSKSESY